jgi:hypothetical protein
MSRPRTLVLCLAISLLAASALAKDKSKAGPTGSFLFKFVGSPVPTGQYVPGLVTLISDGTLLSITGSDEAGPASVFQVKNSSVHGTWVVSRQRITARALYLNFSPVTGEVVGITKLRIEATFDRDFNNITGDFFNSVYVCPTPFTCPDPLEAAPTIPEPVQGRPFTAARIQ